MFCINCGKQIEDGASFCPFCGTAQNTQQQYTQQPNQQQYIQQPNQQRYTQQPNQQQYTQQPNRQQYPQQPGGQPYQQYQQAGQQYPNPQSGGGNDTGSFWWAILGAIIPLVGIIIFFVWRKDKPASAKKAIIGAGVGIVISLLYYWA